MEVSPIGKILPYNILPVHKKENILYTNLMTFILWTSVLKNVTEIRHQEKSKLVNLINNKCKLAA